MIVNFGKEAYLVLVDKDRETITTFRAENISFTQSLDSSTKFEIESYSSPTQFKRENKFLPITDSEIASLFIETNEELEKLGSDTHGQNYYTT